MACRAVVALAFLTALTLSAMAKAAAPEVAVQDDTILVDGAPFVPRGASGRVKLAELKGLGANTVRSYGEEGDSVIAEAERLGLKVILGFWIEHPRRGFDYGNRAMVAAQLDRLRSSCCAIRTARHC